MTPGAPQAAGAHPRAMFETPIGAFNPMLRGAQVAYAPDEETGGGGNTGLSLDDAVALLDQEPDEDPAAGGAAAADAAGEGQAQQQNSEAETSAAEDTPGEAENQTPEGEEGEEQDPAVEPLAAPAYWSTEAKAKFDLLDPELQAVVLAQEGPRETAAAKAKEEAAQTRAQADKEISGVQRFAEELQSFLPQAVQTFRSRWGDNPDWVAFAQTHGTEAMTLAKVQYDTERTLLQQTANAAKVAEETAHVAYLQAEAKTLAEIAPHLADPKDGPAKRAAVAKFLLDQKIPPTQLKGISAVELSIAHDAMLWRESQAKTSLSPVPKTPKPATQPLTRGSAPAGLSDPKAKAAAAATTRFFKTGSIDDAVARLNALE